MACFDEFRKIRKEIIDDRDRLLSLDRERKIARCRITGAYYE